MSTEPLASDRLLERAADFASRFDWPELAKPPRLGVAIVACMDARLDVSSIFGLTPGDAHVIRNAGGTATDDVLRSLAVSQRLLGTTEIMVVHHVDCGMRDLDADSFRAEIRRDAGIDPPWTDGDAAPTLQRAREAVQRLRDSPFLVHREGVRGFVFDERSGRLTEV